MNQTPLFDFREAVMPHVFVVDDDILERDSLGLLLRNEGWQPKAFESAQQFLADLLPVVPSCLILDVSFPATSALELQKRLAIERPGLPVISISNCSDLPAIVETMKRGAVEFLEKPLCNERLLSTIRRSLELSRGALDRDQRMRHLWIRYSSLSPREQQVMTLVASGLANKNVAGELGICEKTVKAHRAQVMQKMKANSLPDLVMMATSLGTVVKDNMGCARVHLARLRSLLSARPTPSFGSTSFRDGHLVYGSLDPTQLANATNSSVPSTTGALH